MGCTRFPHKMNIFGFKEGAACLSRLRILRMDWMHKSLNSRVPLPPLPYISKVNIACLLCSLLFLWEQQLTCVNMPALPVDVLTAYITPDTLTGRECSWDGNAKSWGFNLFFLTMVLRPWVVFQDKEASGSSRKTAEGWGMFQHM